MDNASDRLLVEKTVEIAADRIRAFDYFTRDIQRWWPLGSHSVSAGICAAPAASVEIDGKPGGLISEKRADGQVEVWGRITVWEPPLRLSFTWHPGLSAEDATLVEIIFTEAGEGKCKLQLRHSGWEALGDKAPSERDGYDRGWVPVLFTGFQSFVEHAGAAPASPQVGAGNVVEGGS